MRKSTIKKFFSGPNKLSRLGPVVFVALFAVIGVTYLLGTHAAAPAFPATFGLNHPTGQYLYFNWYKAPDSILVTYWHCGTTTASQVTYQLPTDNSMHNYTTYQDTSANPYISVDGGHINTIPGVQYCSTDTSYVARNLFTIGIDTAPPNVTISSSSGSTTASSITISGNASDGQSGLVPTSLKVNGVAATLSGSSFTANVPLSLGSNQIVASATDHIGNTASSSAITITRTSPPPQSSSGSSSSGSAHTSSPTSTTKKTTSSTSSSSSTLSTGSTPATGSSDQSTTDVQPATDNTNNQLSDFSSSPNVPFNSDSTVTSSDSLVNVTFQKGTFGSTDAYCSVDQGDSHNVPPKSTNALGPYSVDCSDSNGNPLSSLKKAIEVKITLPDSKTKYAAYVNDAAWVKVPSSSNGKTLSFKLTKAEQFAVASTKTSNLGTIIFNVIGLLVLVLLLIGGIFLLRRRAQNQKTTENYWQ